MADRAYTIFFISFVVGMIGLSVYFKYFAIKKYNPCVANFAIYEEQARRELNGAHRAGVLRSDDDYMYKYILAKILRKNGCFPYR
jgi:hypothetical protein